MHIRPARPDEAAVVANVLSAAAAELTRRGQQLWSAAEVSEGTVTAHVRDGRYEVGSPPR